MRAHRIERNQFISKKEPRVFSLVQPCEELKPLMKMVHFSQWEPFWHCCPRYDSLLAEGMETDKRQGVCSSCAGFWMFAAFLVYPEKYG